MSRSAPRAATPRPAAPASAPVEPGAGRAAPSAGRGRLHRVLALVPLLFAAPVIGGIVLSLARLFATADPAVQYASTINDDAAALYLGQPLYQDPDEGYSGILYTPLLPLIVSVLYRGGIWSGWPVVLTLLATVGLGALVARLAYAPLGAGPWARGVAVLEAAGVGALGWLLANGAQINGVYGGNGMHDHAAWLPALAGLVVLPAAARGSRRAQVACLVLLTAAFWTKQTAIGASMAAVLWLVVAAASGAVGRRSAAGLTVALLGLNLAVLGVANVLTAGWQFELSFVVTGEQPLGDYSNSPVARHLPKLLLEDVLPAVALALAFAGAVWIALGARAVRERRAGSRGAGRRGARPVRAALRRPAPLAVGALAGAATALWLRRGGSLNLYFLTAPAEVAEKLIEEFLFPLALVGGAALVAGGLVAAARSPGFGAWLAGASEGTRVATVLLLSLLVGLPLVVYFRQKVGADDNYYIAIAWSLALLAAIGYRRARMHTGPALVAGAAGLGLFAAMLVVSPTVEATLKNEVTVPGLERVVDDGPDPTEGGWFTVTFPQRGLWPVVDRWQEVDPELRDYARTRSIYDREYGDLGFATRGEVWPSYYNFSGLLAAGRTPGFLLEAFLDRRFDAVNAPFATDDNRERFVSGGGRWEDNILWKLNRVLEARYRPTDNVPSEYWERRPGPERDAWMRRCFGPFPVAGTSFRIDRGGGFWCRAGEALSLRDTPAPYSDVRTEEPVRSVAGTVGASMTGGRGFFELRLEPERGEALRVRGTPAPGGGIVLAGFRADREAARLTVPAGGAPGVELLVAAGPRLRLRTAGPGRARLELPSAEEGAVLALGASRGSGTRFDLEGLVLGEG